MEDAIVRNFIQNLHCCKPRFIQLCNGCHRNSQELEKVSKVFHSIFGAVVDFFQGTVQRIKIAVFAYDVRQLSLYLLFCPSIDGILHHHVQLVAKRFWRHRELVRNRLQFRRCIKQEGAESNSHNVLILECLCEIDSQFAAAVKKLNDIAHGTFTVIFSSNKFLHIINNFHCHQFEIRASINCIWQILERPERRTCLRHSFTHIVPTCCFIGNLCIRQIQNVLGILTELLECNTARREVVSCHDSLNHV